MEPAQSRAVAYLRVSTEQQADGVSLDAQRARIAAYAGLYGLDLVAVIEDPGVSARSLARPGLGRALAMLRSRTADALVVAKLDRLTRSVRDLSVLLDDWFAGDRWALLSVSEQIDTRTAGGRLVLNVLASVAQWEREATAERTSEALAHKARKGEFIGGRVPFGWDLAPDGTRLIPVTREQQIIAAAREARARGLSYRAIAAALAQAGFTSRTDRLFDATQIRRMVA